MGLLESSMGGGAEPSGRTTNVRRVAPAFPHLSLRASVRARYVDDPEGILILG